MSKYISRREKTPNLGTFIKFLVASFEGMSKLEQEHLEHEITILKEIDNQHCIKLYDMYTLIF